MNPNEYQKKAHSFAYYEKPCLVSENNMHAHFKQAKVKESCDWAYPCLGLSEEAGELNGKFAKILRDKHGVISSKDKEAISKEIGDCCWMIAEICTVLDLKFEDVLKQNIAKLEDRKARNVLSGSGDNR